MKDIVILGGARTPIGSFLGTLASLSAPRLGSIAIKCALANSGVQSDQVEQVIMGNVLQAAVGQAPARQAGIGAGIPVTAGAVTINKVCGSGLKAVMYAANDIRCGEYDLAVAGGMESMSNAPYALTQARTGYRMGPGKMVDVMIHDGLWDPYGDKHMGNCAETCVAKYEFSRQAQDDYSRESYRRAQEAVKTGKFKKEIAVVEMEGKKGKSIIVDDEEPFSQATAAQEPEWYSTAPAKAIDIVLRRANMTVGDIDLFEVNEAFAAVAMAAMIDVKIPHEKMNVYGGAVALGHPIGCSGARILVTLLHALEQHDRKRGMAAICLGGGEAAAMIVERL